MINSDNNNNDINNNNDNNNKSFFSENAYHFHLDSVCRIRQILPLNHLGIKVSHQYHLDF